MHTCMQFKHQLLSLLCVGVGEYCQVYTCPMMGNQVKGFPRGGCLETLWSADGRKELLPTRLLIALNNKAVLQLHSLSLSSLHTPPSPLSLLPYLSLCLSLSLSLCDSGHYVDKTRPPIQPKKNYAFVHNRSLIIIDRSMDKKKTSTNWATCAAATQC